MEIYMGSTVGGVYTLPEFLTRLGKPPAFADNGKYIKSWHSEADHDWAGTKRDMIGSETAYATTLRLCRDGWLAGIKLLDEVSGQVQAPTPKVIRRTGRWQHEGSEVDMQRIWHGDIDQAFRGTYKSPNSGPARVRILMDSIAAGGDDQATMRWRGVGALKLADLLTEAGYAVQMESVFDARCSSTGIKYKLRVIVKEYADPADLPAIAATTILPAFFRCLQHCWGTVVSPMERRSVSYQVDEAKAEAFTDGDGGCAVFMFGQSIRNAQQASEAVTAAVLSLDEQHEQAA